MKTKNILFVFALLSAAVVLTACGGGGANKKPAGSTADTTAVKTSVAIEEFKPQLAGYYIGSIDRDLPVQLFIYPQSDSILMGQYFYEKIGEDIILTGQNTSGDSFVLEEKDKDWNTLAYFKGIMDKQARISGTWEKADGSKKLSFEMQKVADNDVFTKMEQKILFRMDYPKFPSSFNGSASLNKLMQQAITEEKASFDKMLTDFGEIDAAAIETQWSREITYSINNYDEESISILISTFEYMGGAHPNTYYATKNYILENGTFVPLTLPELFKPGTDVLKTLGPIIFEDLRKQEASWVLDGMVAEITQENLNAWGMRPNHLIFYYSPYEMGPYVQGAFTVVIPAAKIKNILDPKGLLKL